MLIVDKFKRDWLNYIMQSLLTSFVVYLVAVVFHDSEVVLATMGATIFICFAMPKSVSARTTHVIGGHLVGLLCGAIFVFIDLSPHPHTELPIAMGLAFFLMTVLDLEHPPAMGTVVAVIIKDVHLVGAATIMLSISLICLCRYGMKSHIKDLI